MSSKTTNYNLHKIDLADSPPDITVLNQNFDILDEKLKELESGGDKVSSFLLTTEDLNTVMEEGFYRAQSNNTCANKPREGLLHFGMVVIKQGVNAGHCTQILSDVEANCLYKRAKNGTASEWTAWSRIYSENSSITNFTYLAQRPDCYNIPLEIGSFIDLHLPNCENDLDGRIFLGDDRNLYFVSLDSESKSIVTANLPLELTVAEDGTLQIVYDDGSEE